MQPVELPRQLLRTTVAAGYKSNVIPGQATASFDARLVPDILRAASSRVVVGAVPTVSLSPEITDLRFLRARGADGYGWTPLVLSPDLVATIHGHDERIPAEGSRRP